VHNREKVRKAATTEVESTDNASAAHAPHTRQVVYSHYMKNTPKKMRVFNMYVDQPLLDRIDNFRFKHRLDSRSEAVRWLVKAALDQKLAPEKQGATA